MTFDECHRVIKKGDAVALRHAIDGREVDPNLCNRFSWTLLMIAALEGNTAIAELLLERGAAINATNDFGETALSLAAHKGHVHCVRLLLGSGASPDVQPHGHGLEAWLEVPSGLPATTIVSIIEMVEAAKRDRNPLR